MRAAYRSQAAKPPPPLSLVPGDGSELALASLAATVTIEGPLAHTELRMTFTNTEAREREGRFGITLPPGATVGRFAMKIAGAWREARVVSRMRGREVYETFLHQRVDPALLERDLGNRFSARVFPIAPNESKEILLAYEHLVSEVQPYTLALAGLPPVPRVAIAIEHEGATRTLAPDGDSLDDLEIPISGGDDAIAAAGAFVARIDHATADATPAALDRVLVLVDTSASRATVMGRQGQAVKQLLTALPGDALVTVAAFDHTVTELYRGTAGGAGDVTTRLFEHGALGASDLGGALAYAGNHGLERVILVGDGAPTLGERDPAKLADGLATVQRIDAVQIGASIDRETLQRIVGAGRSPGAIVDGRDLDRVAAQLAREISHSVPIRVTGATASWPPTTRGVAPGDPIYVFGLRTGTGPIRVHLGDREITVTPRPATAKRIRRAVAGAELVDLTERIADATGADALTIATRIERLALDHGLVSMQTSLIVLETDADEARLLGPRAIAATAAPVSPQADRTGEPTGADAAGGEVIVIRDTAPVIDASSTKRGLTIDRSYLKLIPVPGRSFEATLGAAPGSVSFAGSTSIENRYLVDAVALKARGRGAFRVKADVMSSLAQDYLAASLSRSAFLGDPPEADDEDAGDDHRAPTPPTSAPALARPFAEPHAGPLHDITTAIASGDRDHALEVATHWQLGNPGDVAAVIGLGAALEARGDTVRAARAYGSILDLYPNRAELLRAAGERLERLPDARATAIEAYRRAVAERPDQATSYRLLAFALVGADRLDEALEVLRSGADKTTVPAVLRVFGEDRVIIEAAIAAKDPSRRAALLGTTPALLALRPSVRFILTWETDANDVDLHVRDRDGNEASYRQMSLVTGGHLAADLTDGYGPEQFSIVEPRAFPYQLAVHYYRRGPMGVGLGTVQVIHHDGQGRITVESRPFVIQNDDAMIELGAVAAR